MRYVKIKGHPNWFLVLESGQKLPSNFTSTMQERMVERVVTEGIHKKNNIGDFHRRIEIVNRKPIDYEELANQYGKIAIRPNGSFMTLYSDDEITDEQFSDVEFFTA